MNGIQKREKEINFKKIFAYIMLSYILIAVAFRFLADKGIDFAASYWWKAAALGVILGLFLLWELIRFQKGSPGFLCNLMMLAQRYRFLIKQLVIRDFKRKYKRSVLGVMWSFLNPLLMMLVQYVVFSSFFKSSIPHFASYLIIGNICFTFFNEANSLCLMSITDNTALLTKVYMPKFIYPFTRNVSSLINLAISIIPMLAVSLLTGVHLAKSAILSLYFFFCLFIFTLGIGTLLSCAMVFFRDVQFLWGILSTIWMYFTPIFYSVDIIPEKIRGLFLLNPLYHYVTGIRECIIGGVSPQPMTYILSFVMAAVMFSISMFVFRKKQDRFVLFL